MATRQLLVFCLFAVASALRLQQQTLASNGTAAATLGARRGVGMARKGGPPCQCETQSPKWSRPNRTRPECLFIDLGASDGESYKVFLGQSSKFKFNFDTHNFKKSDCYAYLMEPNPQFMKSLEAQRSSKVFPMTNMAAYMCDAASADFYLDIYGPNSWGSSLNATHESVRNTNEVKTQVQLYNIIRILVENTIPADTVVMKMDVEGAERDILPCLASSPAAPLLDSLYLEDHCPGDKWCPTQGMAGNKRQVMDEAKAKLVKAGVKIMDFWSPL